MKSIAIPAGLLLAAGTAGHAQPATMVVAETPYTERMGYQPSALASEDGLRGLKSRVRRAARRVCELGIDIPTAEYRERSCYNATLPTRSRRLTRRWFVWPEASAERRGSSSPSAEGATPYSGLPSRSR